MRWVTKVKCIGAGGHAQTDSLGEAPEVVGWDFDPIGLVRSAREVTVFVHVDSGGVDDGVGLLVRRK